MIGKQIEEENEITEEVEQKKGIVEIDGISYYFDDNYAYDDPSCESDRTYNEYSGSYAQDVEGWSDQDIDDVLDGDPDAYWNID